jgi:hypothetical protein
MTDSGSNSPSGGAPPEIDASVPHSARIWNYWLGGKDNYPLDREAGNQFSYASRDRGGHTGLQGVPHPCRRVPGW